MVEVYSASGKFFREIRKKFTFLRGNAAF